MWWAVMSVGAVFSFLPGMLNPYAPVNGLTMLGLGLVAWAAYNLISKGDEWK